MKYQLKIDKRVDKSMYAFMYDSYIEEIKKSLINLSRFSSDLKIQILRLKLEELFLYIVNRDGVGFLNAFNSNYQDIHFTQVIESNKLNKLTVKELSFLCQMSESTFKREFLKRYKTSPIKWFQSQRLKYAYYLLNEEQKRASDIYSVVGYENLSSFIKAYKTKFGVTPKQGQLNF